MKKAVIFSLLLTLLLGLGSVGVTQATHTIPASTNCSGGCLSWVYWTCGSSCWGGQETHEISNPSITNNPGSFQKFDYYGLSGNPLNKSSILIGTEKDSGPVGYCLSTQLKYFVVAYDPFGTDVWKTCVAVPSADVNNLTLFEIWPDSVYAQWDILIRGASGTAFTDNLPYDLGSGLPTAFTVIKYQEQVYDDVSGHKSWGMYQVDNAYAHQNATMYYFNTLPNQFVAANPPQWYWIITPPNSSTGGQLIDCVYQAPDTGCTHLG